MKVFIDANVLVAVLNKEYPAYTMAAKALSWASQQKHELVTSAICVAIASYFAAKKYGNKHAKEKIKVLSEHFTIATCGASEIEKAITDKNVVDFEDGIEYYAALHAGCTCIVTENTRDFYFSAIMVHTPENFLRQFYKTC